MEVPAYLVQSSLVYLLLNENRSLTVVSVAGELDAFIC